MVDALKLQTSAACTKGLDSGHPDQTASETLYPIYSKILLSSFLKPEEVCKR